MDSASAFPFAQIRGGGFEPPSPVSKAGSLPLADPRECPAGVEPACPAWKAGAFAARPRAHLSSRRKERESNPQGSSLDGFRNRCHRQLACPSERAAATGIEPVSGRLTAACSYQHELHRNAISVFRFERMGANVLIGLSKSRIVSLVANVRSWNRWTSARERKSTGWDSNPRFRITGAESSPLNDQCLFFNGIRRTRTVTFPGKNRVCCR
jgi:hypothetical protein